MAKVAAFSAASKCEYEVLWPCHTLLTGLNGGDLTTLLDNVRCKELQISGLHLSSGDTLSLVRSMARGVQWLELGESGEVTRAVCKISSAVKRSIGSTIGFHNHGEGPYSLLGPSPG